MSDLTSAVAYLADVVGDSWTATAIGTAMTCTEADALADVLHLGGHTEEAAAFLVGHADGDHDDEDAHRQLRLRESSADEHARAMDAARKYLATVADAPTGATR